MIRKNGDEQSDFSAQCRAWKEFRRINGAESVDRMVCDPVLRDQFLQILRRILPEANERESLWSLLNARKNKSLRKQLKE
jgi:hypothetical protein